MQVNNPETFLSCIIICAWFEINLPNLWTGAFTLSCYVTGIGLCVQPLYLGEIAPTALRGAMGMGTSIFLTAGILIGQVVGLKYVPQLFDSNPGLEEGARHFG